MNDSKLILIFGGARSGKSTFAEEYAAALGNNVLYIATAAPLDEEMDHRIKIHRERRPKEWVTIEETHDIASVIKKYGHLYDVIMVDCLTLLVTNLMLDTNFPELNSGEISEIKETAILDAMKKFAQVATNVSANVIVVSNEAGLGLVPTFELGRFYRDTMGRVNQLVAQYAQEVYITFAGLPIEIKEMGLATRKRVLGSRFKEVKKNNE